MSSQEAVHVSRIAVTPISGKGTLGTWWFHFQRGGRTQRRPQPCAGDEPKLWANLSAWGRMRTSAWTWWRKGRLTDEISRLQTGPGKSGRPAL